MVFWDVLGQYKDNSEASESLVLSEEKRGSDHSVLSMEASDKA